MSESSVPADPSLSSDAPDPTAVPTTTPGPEVSALSSAAQSTPTDASAPSPESCQSVLVKVAPVPAPDAIQADTEITDPALQSLTERQRLVIQCLGSGMNVTAAAEGAGVDPRTIHRWIKSKPAFAAAFNAWKQETYETARARALAMTDKAMGVIDAAIDKGNVSAAMQVVRGLGVLKPPTTGETSPKRVYRERNIVERLKEQRLHELETSAYAGTTVWTESVRGWDKLLGYELHTRDTLVWSIERQWRDYDKSLHLTEDECNRLGFMRPKGPPAERRPSHFDVMASFERMCAQANCDATTEFNKFIEDGRVAAEAAKGREQALSVLRIPPAKPRTRTAAPTPAQTPAEAPTGA